MTEVRIVGSELILGGQKSGKTARAEALAAEWLAQSPDHRGVYIATAQCWDDEMRERITRHQTQRAKRLPRMLTVEESADLARAIAEHSRADTLVVVDCLTLWLTGLLMPAGSPASAEAARSVTTLADEALIAVLQRCAGPVVLVSNEIGLGVIPMGREVRAFVDALGQLNQRIGAACERVTLMAAGLPLTLKGAP